MSNYSGKESQYIRSHVPDSVRIRHSGRAGNRGVTTDDHNKEVHSFPFCFFGLKWISLSRVPTQLD